MKKNEKFGGGIIFNPTLWGFSPHPGEENYVPKKHLFFLNKKFLFFHIPTGAEQKQVSPNFAKSHNNNTVY